MLKEHIQIDLRYRAGNQQLLVFELLVSIVGTVKPPRADCAAFYLNRGNESQFQVFDVFLGLRGRKLSVFSSEVTSEHETSRA